MREIDDVENAVGLAAGVMAFGLLNVASALGSAARRAAYNRAVVAQTRQIVRSRLAAQNAAEDHAAAADRLVVAVRIAAYNRLLQSAV